MVTGYVVDLVSTQRPASARGRLRHLVVFVFVLAAVVVTFLFLMRLGYRWARTLLTGGGVASVVYAGTSLFSVDRPTAPAVVYAVTRHRRLGADRRRSVPAAPQGRPRLLRSLGLPTMSAPVPERPRIVDAAFWCWLLAAVSLVVLGMLMALTQATCRPSSAVPEFCSRWRDWRSAISRAAPGQAMLGSDGRRSASALALVVVLALFSSWRGGVLWLIPMILTMAGAVLIMRPSAQTGSIGGDAVTQPRASPPPNVLFYEPGASWLWVLAGPRAGIAMLLIQMSAGLGFQWMVPTVFFALVTSFVAVQVKAARIHTSVELTPDHAAPGRPSANPSTTSCGSIRHRRARGAPSGVRARARRAHRRAEGPHRHRRAS